MTSNCKTQKCELPEELPYDFLRTITEDFSDKLRIQEDAFGTLYKGTFCCGKEIAVKKLQENAPLEAYKTFTKEVQNIMALKHENIVRLVAFCSELQKRLVQSEGRYVKVEITESLLCYEYLPNGSLDDYLFGKDSSLAQPGTKVAEDLSTAEGKTKVAEDLSFGATLTKAASDSTLAIPSIDWDTRFKIVKGICQGLLFLHNLDRPIIHMDLNHKSIWLGKDKVPKIANFGLSRLFGQDETRMNTQNVVGSYGYMAPEYVFRGEISAQADIYSLGLMIIEISTGEKNCPKINEPTARRYIEQIREDWTAEHIAFKYSSYDSESLQQVKECITIGLKCVEVDQKIRPSIEEIVDMLNATVR